MTDTQVTAGAAADASAQANSASASAPSVITGDAKQAGDFKSMLGEYASDPAFGSFKDVQGLAKSYKETKSLVGKKLGIPGEGSTEEEKAAFYKALGVPDTEEGYKLDLPEDAPEALKNAYDPENAKKWAGIFKKNGIPANVAADIVKEFRGELLEQYKGYQGDKERSDAEFDKMATEMFGEKKKEAMETGFTYLKKYAPDSLREKLDKMPNDALLAIAAVANGFQKEHLKEDAVIGTSAQGSQAKTTAQLREEARQLMSQPEYNNPFKNPEEHARLKEQVGKIYDQIKRVG